MADMMLDVREVITEEVNNWLSDNKLLLQVSDKAKEELIEKIMIQRESWETFTQELSDEVVARDLRITIAKELLEEAMKDGMSEDLMFRIGEWKDGLD
jgi:hypothetical protein